MSLFSPFSGHPRPGLDAQLPLVRHRQPGNLGV